MPNLFSSPQAPPSINPQQVVQQSARENSNAAANSAYLNNVNQVTPWGSLKYDQTSTIYDYNNNPIPQFTATQTLSPEQKALYDKQMQVTQGAYDLAGQYVGRVGEATKDPFSLSGAPAAGTVPTYHAPAAYDEAYRQQALDTINQRAQPMQQRDRMALETRMGNQGISMGTEAYKNGMDDYNRGVNDFRLGADIQAGQDAATRYGLQLQGANQEFNAGGAAFGMQNQGRQNYATEQQMLRMQPIQEISALMGTGGGQQNPTFAPQTNYQVQAPDVGGIYGMAAAQDQANYQSQMRSQSAGLGGLVGLAGTLGGAALMGPAGGMLGGFLGRAAGSGTQW